MTDTTDDHGFGYAGTLFTRQPEHPGRHRTNGSPTSVAGASDVRFRAGTQMHRLLVEFADDDGLGGWTDEEAARDAGLLSVTYWMRCSDLRRNGCIAFVTDDDGAVFTRVGRAGSQRMISAITPLGRAYLTTLEPAA